MRADDGYNSLVDAIASGQAIAVVGAGSSCRVGLPGWNALLGELSQRARKQCPNRANDLDSLDSSGDALLRAQEYQKILGRDLVRQIIVDIYTQIPRPCEDFHKNLIRLPFSNYLTGNYDLTLERAYSAVVGGSPRSIGFHDVPAVDDFTNSLTSGRQPRTIAHYHGSVDHPEGIVLTLEDYDDFYRGSRVAEIAFSSIFQTCRCVFIGCGLSSEDLGPLRLVTAVMGSDAPKHFAILEQPEPDKAFTLRRSLANRYRIEPVYYPKSTDHAAFAPFIEKLLVDVQNARQNSTGHGRVHDNLVLEKVEFELLDASGGDAATQNLVRQLVATVRQRRQNVTIAHASEANDQPEDLRVALDDEIDRIFQLVKRGCPDAAVAAYQELEVREAGHLTARLAYRVHANIGNALNSMGRSADAAAEYLRARSLRGTRDAKALEGLAYVLMKEYSKAHALARQLVNDHPDFGRGYWLLICSLADGTPFAEAEALVPDTLRTDGEVALALGGVAFEQQLSEEAIAYGRAALIAAPDWVEALLNLAGALLMRAKQTARVNVDRGPTTDSRHDMEEVERLVDRALAHLPVTDTSTRRAVAYLNRATARRLLGKTKTANDDLREAYRLAPDDPTIAGNLASVLEGEGDRDGAIHILERFGQRDDLVVLLALFLAERANVGDRDRATQLLEPMMARVSDRKDHLATDAVGLLAKLYSERGTPDKARDLVNTMPQGGLPPTTRAILMASISRRAGDVETAKTHLSEGAEAIRAKANWAECREAAVLAHNLGDYAMAVSFWRCISRPDVLDSDTYRALGSARLASDDAYILAYCRGLRKHGYHDRHVYEFEADSLVRCYEHRQAIGLLQHWLGLHPEDKPMRVTVSLVALELGETSAVERDPRRLPSVDEISDVEDGLRVHRVLNAGKEQSCAHDFAYQLWRRFPDDERSQHVLISDVMCAGKGTGELAIATVGVQTAACYRDLATSEMHTAVIEDGPSPSVTRNEYAPDHPFAKALLGKAVGEEFAFQGHRYVLESLMPKAAFRARACMEGFPYAFPDSTAIRRFSMPPVPTASTDPRAVLGEELFDALQSDYRRQNALKGLYTSHGMPISWLARGLGRSVLETMGHLASSEELGIRCSHDTDEAWNEAIQVATSARVVVLDDVALASVFMLGLAPKIGSFPFKCVVPDAALQEWRESHNRFAGSRAHAGYLGFVDGRPVFQEASPEAERAWAAQLADFLAFVGSTCEIVGGEVALTLSSKQREVFEDAMGPGTTHALAIAHRRKIPLWTDDLTTATLAHGELGVKSFWSQVAVLSSIRDLGLTAASTAIAKMFAWQYRATRLTVHAAALVFKEAKWRAHQGPADRVFSFVTSRAALNVHNCLLTQHLIVKIWIECPSERKARKLISELLNQIGRGLAGKHIARPLYRCPFAHLPPHLRDRRRRLSAFLRKWRSVRATAI